MYSPLFLKPVCDRASYVYISLQKHLWQLDKFLCIHVYVVCKAIDKQNYFAEA